MLDKHYIRQQLFLLTLKASSKYNVAPETCHLGHLVLQGLLERPHRINQIDAATGEKETNISVAKRSMRLASAMANYGMKVEDTVVIMGLNNLDLTIPFYACHYNGYSVNGIDPRTGTSDIKNLIVCLKPKIVFCDKSCEEKIREALMNGEVNSKIVIFGGNDSELEPFILRYKGTEINFRPTLFDQYKVPAWLVLTSGTTGDCKTVSVPYATVLNSVCCWWERMNKKIEIALNMSNFHWVSSYMCLITAPIRNYTKLQSSVPLTLPSLVDIINTYKPNSTAWIPNLFNEILKIESCDLSCFTYIAIGGASVDQEVFDKFRKKYTARLDFIYSQTELLVPIFNYDENTPAGSVGYPTSKYQFRLVDDEGNTIEKPDKSGELWVKGDDFFKEYFNNPEETKKVYTVDGWLRTGDVLYRDEENFYYFVERKKNLIKHLFFLISPSQMEDVVRRHPGVREVCVVGIPHKDYAEVPVAAILKKENHEVDPQDIFDMFKKTLSELKQLRGGIFFVDSFTYTHTGKINRAILKKLALTTPKIFSK